MCLESDRDFMDALANLDFVNNVIKMEREKLFDQTGWKNARDASVNMWQGTMVETAYSPTE